MTRRSRVNPIVSRRRQQRSLSIVRKYFPQVESVEDATRSLKIEVTSRDVSTSKRKAHAECAMAVACKRVKELDGVLIATSVAYLIKGDKATRYEVPNSVAREVVAFDRGAAFEPGEYHLDKPYETKRLGHQEGGHAKHPGTGKPHQRRHITENVRAILGSDSER